MKASDVAVAEIKEFLETLAIDSPFSRASAASKYKLAYKKLHSLLVWNMVLSQKSLPQDKFGFHFHEGVSDVSQGYGLLALSLYKPARMMARSGVENFIRVAVAHRDGNYKARSVYELFDEARFLFGDSKEALSDILELQRCYGLLCLTVHSAAEDHLSLSVSFESQIEFDKTQFDLTVGLLEDCCGAINRLLFCLFSKNLYEADHRNRDLVLDTLPRLLKRAYAI
jgi:hypothetical protein